MFDHIVFDTESKKLADEVGGWDNCHLMELSCAVVYEYKTDRFRTYGPEDVAELRERILRADRVTSFNGERFDFPLIFERPRRQMPKELIGKSDDLMRKIAVGRNMNPDAPYGNKGWGLDSVCTGTLNRGKIDCGVHAPQLFKEGKWAKLATYCQDDTTLTRDLADFIDKFGYCMNGKDEKILLPPWRYAASLP